jgi:ABC-type multidrug transport system permease subunit
LGLGFVPLQALGWIIAALLLCWAVLSGIGFVISTYLRRASIYTLNNLANILGLGLVFLPPVYYPEELLGGLSWIGIFFPTSNAAGLIRALFRTCSVFARNGFNSLGCPFGYDGDFHISRDL